MPTHGGLFGTWAPDRRSRQQRERDALIVRYKATASKVRRMNAGRTKRGRTR